MHHQDVVRLRRLGPAVLLAMFLFFLLAAISQAGADRSHGLLWEISKPGQPPTWLFGTIHSEDPEVLNLPAPVRQAFDDADSVVLEMLMDKEAMMYSATAMLMLDGRTLQDVVGQPLYGKVASAIASRGISEPVLSRMKPWAAAVTLSMPAPETGQVLDLVLYQQALQQDKAVYGLETLQEQLDVFDKMSEEDQVTLLRDTVEHMPELDDMLVELLAVYKRRDIGGMMAINEASMRQGDQAMASKFQQRLIEDRNHRMASRMQPYLRRGKAFVAVGALHLPGEEGLLSLLAQQGYTVRRVY